MQLERLEEQYALIEINYRNDYQTLMVVSRIITNQEDHSYYFFVYR